MSRFRTILCPIDLSESSQVTFGYAESLARHLGASLTVQHVLEMCQYTCLDYAPPDCCDEFHRILAQRASKQLSDFIQESSANPIRPKQVVEWGSVPDSILALAEAGETDLVVMGTHGRRGVDRFLLGSVTERVIRKAHCPVMAVPMPQNAREAPGNDNGFFELNRILCCVDFSESCQRTLEYATSLAHEYGSDLVLVNVLEGINDPTEIEASVTTASNRLAELVPAEGFQSKYQGFVRIGKPYQQIIALSAEAQCDLVIVGERGGNISERNVLGSTTHRVIQLGHRPVLVVRGSAHA